MSKKSALAILLGLLGVGAFLTRRLWIARSLGLTPSKYDVVVQQAVPIPMPDGVRLVADHYAPKSDGAFPTILMRTPYGRDRAGGLLGLIHEFLCQRFAERGYHVIIQDVRGRFSSEGTWEPFVDEARDGRATLEWIARQPWFDGNLGMWGQSYGGYVQWAVAPGAPEYLRAIVPSITGSQINPFTGTAFALDGMVRWVYNVTRQGGFLERVITESPRYLDPQQERRLKPAFDHLPISESEQFVVGEPVAYYRKWLASENARTDAPFWQSIYHGAQMDQVRAATHFIAGWYDIFLYQTLQDYAMMHAAGHVPYLTIGPWRHLDLGGVAETLRSGLAWFDVQLKGRRRRLCAKPVQIFVMGANVWREFDDFPPPARETFLFLDARGKLSFDAPAIDSAPDDYRYDPANPTPSFGGAVYGMHAGSVDNRLLETSEDVLTYTTPPLESAVDVIGQVRAELFVQSSLEHTDFFARLCDVYPDGRSMNICDGLLRVEPGVGELQADGTRRIVINMWATAQRFARGHRMRLQVSSGAHPRWARNLGTGEPLATATRMQVAEQKVFHDRAHPSALILPVRSDVILNERSE